MTPGNYLEHAVTSFHEHRANALRDPNLERVVWYFDTLFPVALKSPRFFLPDQGIAVQAELKHLTPPIRLPHPCTVMEFTAEKWKIVLIAIEHQRKDGGLSISTNLVADWGMPSGIWSPGLYTTFVECSPIPIGADGAIYADISDERTNKPVNVGEINYESWDAQMTACTLSLILALQCCNVKTSIIPASVPLNKKRAAKGKLPFVDYKILTIDGAGTTTPTNGGTHASPRQHLRRGHIRRLSDERRVWVQQCMVGDPRKGLIVKDYQVRA